MSTFTGRENTSTPSPPSTGAKLFLDNNLSWKSIDENGVITTLGSTNVFGTEAQYAEDLTQSENATTTFQTKLDLVTTNLTGGLYKLEFSAEMQKQSASNSIFAELARDPSGDDEVLFVQIKEPKDNTDWLSWSGIRILNISGVQTFRIRFRTETGGNPAKLRRVTIALSRWS